jgi:CRP-like cAMP-binding protein
MAYWMCSNCGYYYEGSSPPERCPSCKQSCVFNNVTNYVPGASGAIDIRVADFGGKNTVTTQPREAFERIPPVLEAIPPTYVFGNLSPEQRQRVQSLERVETYEANAVIGKQGTPARKLWLVDEGRVSVQYELPGGKNINIAIVSSGGSVGWSALVRPHLLTATIVAVSRSRLRAIEGEALLRLMREDTRLGLLIMQDIAETVGTRLRNLEARAIGLA